MISSGMVYKSNFKAGDKIIARGLSSENNILLTYPNGETLDLKSGDEVKEDNQLGVYKLNVLEEKELFSVNFPIRKRKQYFYK